MTPLEFILRSLRHHRRMHYAVGAGVAVATAVLTGALLVGDSVRGSLRDLALERLGRIDSVLVASHFFREALAEEVSAEPAILIPATLQAGSGADARRATQVSAIGCRETFWALGQGGPGDSLRDGDVAITESLARELGVAVGERVFLRVPIAGAIPADSVLGKKSDTSDGRWLRVAAVLPPEGLARFSLMPSQHWPRNAFVPLATMQNLLDKPGRVNALMVDEAKPRGELRPTLEDYGLRVESIASPKPGEQISADQLVLPDEVVKAAERAFAADGLQPVVTYLANTLVIGEGDARRQIPYSTITGVDSTAALGPLLDVAGQPIRLADDEIALNRWAADDLGAYIGDLVTVTFYEPESTHAVLRKHEPPLKLWLAQIAELEQDGKPTPAADPLLTPELPGVTDADSVANWELPFKLVEPIWPQDEAYWDEHRTTPKAFVSLATAKRLWPSRWGTISLLRIPVRDGEAASDFGELSRAAAADAGARLLAQLKPVDAGLVFQPVGEQSLLAASGTTPFDALFLMFSLFLIAAAVMLIALLFKLGVEQRASELGLLAAMGVPQRRIARLLTREGAVVAAAGAAAGVFLGVVYAWLIIFGLRTWWLDAIATPFLSLHVALRSLLIGWLAGFVVSWLTIRIATRQLAQLPAGRLLAGATEPVEKRSSGSSPSSWPRFREALVALAVALGIVGYLLRGETQAGVFFATGATVLVLLLGEIRHWLRAAARSTPSRGRMNLPALAALNTARHPGRSALTIGLVATATFLIAAVSAFRLETTDEGTGGFSLLATSDQPIHFDLNTPQGRRELGFSDADEQALADWRTFTFRVADGEDASCLNLYRPTQPRVLGVPRAFVVRGGFAWADAAGGDAAKANPWLLLDAELGNDADGRPIVPVVLDANTATYSLKIGRVGKRLTIRDAADRPVTLQVVGLLKNSVLQGNLLLSEANFLRMFPDVDGYRFFFMEGQDDADRVAQKMETTLSADGLDVVDAREKLADYLAVQNTYLSTFQSLGALGLLLGTVGLAVVQLRNVIERRRELALMRAEGFRANRLVAMVVLENGLLLVGGLLVGVLAAAVALAPQWAPRGAQVPWGTLAALLALIAVVGLAAGWWATRSTLRAPIIGALRGD